MYLSPVDRVHRVNVDGAVNSLGRCVFTFSCSYFSGLSTLKIMLSNGRRHTGHSAFTLDHSKRQVRQKLWKHPLANDSPSMGPRQIGQLGSGDFDSDTLLDLLGGELDTPTRVHFLFSGLNRKGSLDMDDMFTLCCSLRWLFFLAFLGQTCHNDSIVGSID